MIPIKRSRWWLALALFAILLTSTALALAAPAPLARLFTADTSTGYDPLTEREIETVRQNALADPAITNHLTSNARQELLLIERHQEDKAVYQTGRWERRADVYIYNYDTDSLVHAIYNLSTNQLDSVTANQNDQLPLTTAETNRALELAFNDPTLRPLLNEQYTQITGRTLTTPDQVETKTFVFHASALPGLQLAPTVATCGLNRCAQLLIYTSDSFAFELLPIVNLSTEQVDLVPFGESNEQ